MKTVIALTKPDTSRHLTRRTILYRERAMTTPNNAYRRHGHEK